MAVFKLCVLALVLAVYAQQIAADDEVSDAGEAKMEASSSSSSKSSKKQSKSSKSSSSDSVSGEAKVEESSSSKTGKGKGKRTKSSKSSSSPGGENKEASSSNSKTSKTKKGKKSKSSSSEESAENKEAPAENKEAPAENKEAPAATYKDWTGLADIAPQDKDLAWGYQPWHVDGTFWGEWYDTFYGDNYLTEYESDSPFALGDQTSCPAPGGKGYGYKDANGMQRGNDIDCFEGMCHGGDCMVDASLLDADGVIKGFPQKYLDSPCGSAVFAEMLAEYGQEQGDCLREPWDVSGVGGSMYKNGATRVADFMDNGDDNIQGTIPIPAGCSMKSSSHGTAAYQNAIAKCEAACLCEDPEATAAGLRVAEPTSSSQGMSTLGLIAFAGVGLALVVQVAKEMRRKAPASGDEEIPLVGEAVYSPPAVSASLV